MSHHSIRYFVFIVGMLSTCIPTCLFAQSGSQRAVQTALQKTVVVSDIHFKYDTKSIELFSKEKSSSTISNGSLHVRGLPIVNRGAADGVLIVKNRVGDVIDVQVIAGHKEFATSISGIFKDGLSAATELPGAVADLGKQLGDVAGLTEYDPEKSLDAVNKTLVEITNVDLDVPIGGTVIISKGGDLAYALNIVKIGLGVMSLQGMLPSGLDPAEIALPLAKELKGSLVKLGHNPPDGLDIKAWAAWYLDVATRVAKIIAHKWDFSTYVSSKVKGQLVGAAKKLLGPAGKAIEALQFVASDYTYAWNLLFATQDTLNSRRSNYLWVGVAETKPVTVSSMEPRSNEWGGIFNLLYGTLGLSTNFSSIDTLVSRITDDYGYLFDGSPLEEAFGTTRQEDTRNRVLVTTRKKAHAKFLRLKRRVALHQVDVLLLADNTGSMSGEIAEVRRQAQAIFQALLGKTDPRFKNVDIRIGVARFSDDQVVNPGAAGYELLLPITRIDTSQGRQKIQQAIDQWNASWGYGAESSFWAIQQGVTGGEGTPRYPNDNFVATGQKTDWRPNAAKVIVVFGDEPSYQTSINEKELHQLLEASGVHVSLIDSGLLNDTYGGHGSSQWDDTNGFQAVGAAQEIADTSGGAYIRLRATGNIDEAIKNAIFDAITQNERTGGQLARVSAGTWRQRTPSSVTALTPDDGKTFDFTLRHPGSPEATFSVKVDEGVDVPGAIYFERTDMTGLSNIFGSDLSADSVVQFTKNKDFVRFVLRGVNPQRQSVEGYYGMRLDSSELPTGGSWAYALSSRSASPFDGRVYSSGELTTHMGIDWETDKVFARDLEPPIPGDGVGVFVGMVNRSEGKVQGKYVAIPYPESATDVGYIRDTGRGNTSLRIFGETKPRGLGGTFSAYWFDKYGGNRSYTSMLMGGFWDQTNPPARSVLVNTWQGLATAQVYDPDTGEWSIALSDGPDDVRFEFQQSDGTFEGRVSVVGDSGETYTLQTASENSAYVGATSFGAIKTVNGKPAHIATVSGASSNVPDQYNFMSWGTWNKKTGMARGAAVVSPGSSWVAGRITPGHDIPTMGSASYTGDVMGRLHTASGSTGIHGDLSLTAHFDSRDLTGSFSNFRRSNGSAWLSGQKLRVNADWASEVNAIHGSIDGPGTLDGTMNGAFFGSHAEEVGGNWRVSGGGVKAGGVFAGHEE